MVPFSIAGIQTHVAAVHDNLQTMLHKLALTIERFPWVQMVMMSELATCGPLTQTAQPRESAARRVSASFR